MIYSEPAPMSHIMKPKPSTKKIEIDEYVLIN